ncbi:MAG: hypothetical protein CFE45_34715 [Burkholderiales bacterium PBB5]|nr:MAG: hypothetical protein CFE45_34715 [Burkholderiales bacterium PBB5]
MLSTKVGRLLHPDPDVADDSERYGFCSNLPFRPVYDYSHDGIMRSFEASLQRLGLARIDILLVHDIGELTHGAEADAVHWRQFVDGGLRALERLRAEGSVGAIGLGVNETAVCERAMEVGQFDCFLLAGRYTLLDAALQFPLAHPQVACVIPGMGSARRVASALAQYHAPIPGQFWRDMVAAGLIDSGAPLP